MVMISFLFGGFLGAMLGFVIAILAMMAKRYDDDTPIHVASLVPVNTARN